MQTLRIEDDDGFVTEWPWPEDKLALANGSFVAIFETQHDALRQKAGLDCLQDSESAVSAEAQG